MTGFENPLAQMATIYNVPLEVYHDSLVGSIEFELDCRAEDHDEAGRVAGLHTSYPRFYNRDLVTPRLATTPPSCVAFGAGAF